MTTYTATDPVTGEVFTRTTKMVKTAATIWFVDGKPCKADWFKTTDAAVKDVAKYGTVLATNFTETA